MRNLVTTNFLDNFVTQQILLVNYKEHSVFIWDLKKFLRQVSDSPLH